MACANCDIKLAMLSFVINYDSLNSLTSVIIVNSVNETVVFLKTSTITVDCKRVDSRD